MSYLVLPHLKVQRANALATPYMIGVCPVFAAVMLAHTIGRQTEVLPTGVALMHHDATLLADQDLPEGYGAIFPHQFRSASFIDKDDYTSSNKSALALQPTATAHLEVSLVLAYDGLAPDPSQVEAVLQSARLAGGLIIEHAPVLACGNLTGEGGVFSRLKSGFWVLDRTSLLDPKDRLGSLLEFLYPKLGTRSEPLAKAFVAPAVLGYAMLTDFEARDGAREGVPHAYAEPMLGLVQYESARQLEEGTALFWIGRWHEREAFVLHQTLA